MRSAGLGNVMEYSPPRGDCSTVGQRCIEPVVPGWNWRRAIERPVVPIDPHSGDRSVRHRDIGHLTNEQALPDASRVEPFGLIQETPECLRALRLVELAMHTLS